MNELIVIQRKDLEEIVKKSVVDAIASSSQSTVTKMLDAKGAAEFLGLDRNTIYQLTRAGKLPHRKIGSLCRYDPLELRKFEYDPEQARQELFSQEMKKRRRS